MSNQNEKTNLHPRNKNRQRYDLDALIVAVPALENYLKISKGGAKTLDFAAPQAVKLLNTAILKHHYGIAHWDFTDDNLCPPIPSRAEYIHHLADLLGEYNEGKIIKGKKITCLDIGVGATCIYPILGITEYGWKFIASDVNPKSLKQADAIANINPSLKGKIDFRIQSKPERIFRGVINRGDEVDIVVCNPPFHSSMEEAIKGNQRKVKRLTKYQQKETQFNFSGNTNELVYKGGEFQFTQNMVAESKAFGSSIFWFSTLVSKEANLKKLEHVMRKYQPTKIKTINIKTGNKIARILAWTFFTEAQIKEWKKTRLTEK